MSRFNVYLAAYRDWRWVLVDEHDTVIATSGEGFDTAAVARESIEAVKRDAADAETVDLTGEAPDLMAALRRSLERPRPETPAKPSVHKPFGDDGVTYCGWATGTGIVDGCGHIWPCPTERARRGSDREMMVFGGTAPIKAATMLDDLARTRTIGLDAAEAKGYRRAVDKLSEDNARAVMRWADETGNNTWLDVNEQAVAFGTIAMVAAYLEATAVDR